MEVAALQIHKNRKRARTMKKFFLFVEAVLAFVLMTAGVLFFTREIAIRAPKFTLMTLVGSSVILIFALRMLFNYLSLLTKVEKMVTVSNIPTTTEEGKEVAKKVTQKFFVFHLRRLFQKRIWWMAVSMAILAFPAFRASLAICRSFAPMEPYSVSIWLPQKYQVLRVNDISTATIVKERFGSAIWSSTDTSASLPFQRYKEVFNQSEHFIFWTDRGDVAYFTSPGNYLYVSSGVPEKPETGLKESVSLNNSDGDFRRLSMTEKEPGTFEMRPGRNWGASIVLTALVAAAYVILSAIAGELIFSFCRRSQC